MSLCSPGALGKVQDERKYLADLGRPSNERTEGVNVALQRVSGVSALQGCDDTASSTRRSDPLEGALF